MAVKLTPFERVFGKLDAWVTHFEDRVYRAARLRHLEHLAGVYRRYVEHFRRRINNLYERRKISYEEYTKLYEKLRENSSIIRALIQRRLNELLEEHRFKLHLPK